MKHPLRLAILILAVLTAPQIIRATGREPQTPAHNASPLRIAIVGDSTVCDYPEDNPCRGWGQFIQGCFQPGVKVFNHAASGRSTKTFIKEGRWTATLKEKPDIVLIQFGHNDSHGPTRPESTDAATDYRDFLRRYVDESRAAGATPILVTPMCRRIYTPDGKLDDALLPYSNAMKAVAAERHAALVDLHDVTAKLFAKLGAAGTAEFANAPGDRTHFNERGAKAMAELVMKDLPSLDPRLGARILSPAK